MIFREGELEFDFTGAAAAERLDEQGVPVPHGMRFVDFVVEEPSGLLLVEVKDPSESGATPRSRAEWLRRLRCDSLVNETLVPKCRDSYTYLHLMERDDKPITYLVVLGLCGLPTVTAAHLQQLNTRLRARLAKEAAQPWKRAYAPNCAIVNVADWGTAVGRYSVVRTPP